MGTVVMGKVESGSITEGDSLLVMPNKVCSLNLSWSLYSPFQLFLIHCCCNEAWGLYVSICRLRWKLLLYIVMKPKLGVQGLEKIFVLDYLGLMMRIYWQVLSCQVLVSCSVSLSLMYQIRSYACCSNGKLNLSVRTFCLLCICKSICLNVNFHHFVCALMLMYGHAFGSLPKFLC